MSSKSSKISTLVEPVKDVDASATNNTLIEILKQHKILNINKELIKNILNSFYTLETRSNDTSDPAITADEAAAKANAKAYFVEKMDERMKNKDTRDSSV